VTGRTLVTASCPIVAGPSIIWTNIAASLVGVAAMSIIYDRGLHARAEILRGTVRSGSREGWRNVMKTISLIAAGVLALGWGTAMAETSPSAVTSGPRDDATMPPPHVSVDVDVDPAPPVTPADETPGPTTN